MVALTCSIALLESNFEILLEVTVVSKIWEYCIQEVKLILLGNALGHEASKL